MKPIVNYTAAAVTLLALSLLSSVSFAADEPAKAEAAAGDVEKVTHKGLTLNLPKSWEEVPSSSSMRLATYHTPVADGDSEPAELSLFSFPGGGGGAVQNIERWVGQFSSTGRKSAIKTGEASGNTYYIVDVTGTYQKPVGPPILRKTEAAENFRMLAVILEIKEKGVFYLKLTGPKKTVDSQADAFRKSFGGKVETEEEYAI